MILRDWDWRLRIWCSFAPLTSSSSHRHLPPFAGEHLSRWSLYLATRCFCLIPRRSLTDSLVVVLCVSSAGDAATALESAPPPPKKGESPARAAIGERRRGSPFAQLPVVARRPKREAASTAWSPFAAAAAVVERLEREGTRIAFCAQFTQAPRPGKIGPVGTRTRSA